MNKYDKLIRRFFEALLLLAALGRTRANHTNAPKDENEDQATRRRFLRNITSRCDFEKGGHTTSTATLEDHETGYTLWIGANVDLRQKTIPFIQTLFGMLAQYWALPEKQQEQRAQKKDKMIRFCHGFSKDRIKKEKSLLTRNVRHCDKVLSLESCHENNAISEFLAELSNLSGTELCQRAYEARNSTIVQHIKKRKATSSNAPGQPSRDPFAEVHHYIGRLAHHFRAIKELIEDYPEVSMYFEPLDVKPVPILAPAWPVHGQPATMEQMINRMTSDETSKERYVDALADMDRKFDTFSKVTERMQAVGQDYQPVGHAECNTLEHFHRNRLRYVDDDRYIACSKPACFCCQLYFKNHPAHCVIPQSHQNVWDKWAPPLLEGSMADPRYKEQRNILQSMIEAIRHETFEQLDKDRYTAPPWHHDTETKITEPSLVGHASDSEGQMAHSDGGFDDEPVDSEGHLTSPLTPDDTLNLSAQDVTETRPTSPESDSEHKLTELVRGLENLRAEDAAVNVEDPDDSDGGAAL